MVPTDPIPYRGMIPMMPFGQASPGKNTPCIILDKKSMQQGYMIPPFGQDGQKDKSEASKQPGKSDMIGIPMPVSGMPSMPGMGGMSMAFMGPQGMQGMPGMPGMPGMQMQGMPQNGSGMPFIQFTMSPQDFFKMSAAQGKNDGQSEKTSNDEHRNGGESKKMMPEYAMIQGMPGMPGMPGMQMMPSMMNMSQIMQGQVPQGFAGMQIAGFPGGAMSKISTKLGLPPGMAPNQPGQMG